MLVFLAISIFWINKCFALLLMVEYTWRLELLKNTKRFCLHCERMATHERIIAFLLLVKNWPLLGISLLSWILWEREWPLIMKRARGLEFIREWILKLTVLWTPEQIHEIDIMISVYLMHICVTCDTDMGTDYANRDM